MNIENLLKVPRNAGYLMGKLGIDFLDKLPEETVRATGSDDGQRQFYWIPILGNKRQIKALNSYEIDIASAIKVNER